MLEPAQVSKVAVIRLGPFADPTPTLEAVGLSVDPLCGWRSKPRGPVLG